MSPFKELSWSRFKACRRGGKVHTIRCQQVVLIWQTKGVSASGMMRYFKNLFFDILNISQRWYLNVSLITSSISGNKFKPRRTPICYGHGIVEWLQIPLGCSLKIFELWNRRRYTSIVHWVVKSSPVCSSHRGINFITVSRSYTSSFLFQSHTALCSERYDLIYAKSRWKTFHGAGRTITVGHTWWF